ncbi:TRAP transporter substrate-binding protein DctP [Petroclostridium sp. X23]|uniref:TRAP transporter substrate-binding protein DctP n=1 Tax=Petroclostridium sp. X23 TaxID=3045146 RepID=UPI0024ACFC9A|nr:TRAP transporter substrate-binding protein DctP [Petroclostridium sp. X23]WHH56936.1 TRAP transporter substrate-binding protein DctP [Petroclostridium sp. X23]
MPMWRKLGRKKLKKVELKISHVLPNTEPIHEELVNMAAHIKERSNGTLIVQVYPDSELGNNKDNLEQAMRGANIVTVADPGYMADCIPDYGIMDGPFLYDDYKDIQKLAASAWHQEMVKASAENGIPRNNSNIFEGEICLKWFLKTLKKSLAEQP